MPFMLYYAVWVTTWGCCWTLSGQIRLWLLFYAYLDSKNGHMVQLMLQIELYGPVGWIYWSQAVMAWICLGNMQGRLSNIFVIIYLIKTQGVVNMKTFHRVCREIAVERIGEELIPIPLIFRYHGWVIISQGEDNGIVSPGRLWFCFFITILRTFFITSWLKTGHS